MTPWKGPSNDAFYTYKAHEDCNEKWKHVGADVDWLLPPTTSEWEYMTQDIELAE